MSLNPYVVAAARRVTDSRQMLRELATVNNLRYRSESGAKHHLYIPEIEQMVLDSNNNPVVERDEAGNVVYEMDLATNKPKVGNDGKPIPKYKKERVICAQMSNVHEWTSVDGKYRATLCTKDVFPTEEGKLLGDGSCPFCDRIKDAWDICHYRIDRDKEALRQQGVSESEIESRLKAISKPYYEQLKVRNSQPYLYLLVIQFRSVSKDGRQPVIGSDGLPEFDLKINKLSPSRLEKYLTVVENSGFSDMANLELLIQYADSSDRRLAVSQSVINVVMPQQSFVSKYPALKEKIDQAVSKFDLLSALTKTYPEWSGMTPEQARKETDEMFEMWDNYQKELKINPGASYMEYISAPVQSTPAIGSGIPTPGAVIPGAPVSEDTGNKGNVSTIPQAPQIPGLGFSSAQMNAMFGGVNLGGNGGASV